MSEQFNPEEGVAFVLDADLSTLRKHRGAVLAIRATVAKVAALDAELGSERTDVEILSQGIRHLPPLPGKADRVLTAKEFFARCYTAAQLELARARTVAARAT